MSFFVQGSISPQFIADCIAAHQKKTHIGAHNIFLGQVRADVVDHKKVVAIDFSAHEEIATKTLSDIRESAFQKYASLSCLHIRHSLGVVHAGELCFFVFVSAPRRKFVYDALSFIVEEIKRQAPIFGKEIVEDGSHIWKKNTL